MGNKISPMLHFADFLKQSLGFINFYLNFAAEHFYLVPKSRSLFVFFKIKVSEPIIAGHREGNRRREAFYCAEGKQH